MKRLTYIAWGLLISIILLSWKSMPPIARSGAPGEGSCADAGCHSPSNDEIDGIVNLIGIPEKYDASTNYNLSIQLQSTKGMPDLGGFQMVAVDKNRNGIGTFINAGDSTVVFSSGTRNYVEHSPARSFGSDSTLNYTVTWRTPDSLSLDTTTFYIAANFADGTGSSNNDRVILASFASIPNRPGDADNDGFTSDIDCDDTNPDINPDATEIVNNDVDENCDGNIEMIDEDMDGFNSDIDCDDTNPDINPDASEIPNNNIDENCDGMIDTIDVDMDGFNSSIDCDDMNPAINPDATEIPNNNVDENCDGLIQMIDEDMDGFNSDIDCDDTNPNINPDATEIPDNQVDENCDGSLVVADESVKLSGRVTNANGMALPNVGIIISGITDTFMTDANGQFEIDSLESLEGRTLTLSKNTNAANGVSSIDIITSINYILGRQDITNQNILDAADVSGDDKISTIDLVQMTNVILGKWDEFPDRPSWIFAPSVINLDDANLDLSNLNVIAYKLGDLSGDADPTR